jgi:hypothetical protein
MSFIDKGEDAIVTIAAIGLIGIVAYIVWILYQAGNFTGITKVGKDVLGYTPNLSESTGSGFLENGLPNPNGPYTGEGYGFGGGGGSAF